MSLSFVCGARIFIFFLSSRLFLPPSACVAVNAFPPRNRVRVVSLFGYLLVDGLGFFPEGRGTFCRHELMSIVQRPSATDKSEMALKTSSGFHDDVTLF